MQIECTSKKILLIAFAAFHIIGSVAQSTEITIKVQGLENSPLILANYYGDKQYVKDTFFLEKTGVCNIKLDTFLPRGVYLAVFPALGNRYFEFILSEPKIVLATDTADLAGHMKVELSAENKIFYDDMIYLSEMRKKIEKVNASLKVSTNEVEKAVHKAELEKINREVQTKRKSVEDANPTFLYSKLLRSMRDIELPKDGPRDAKGMLLDSDWQWHFYKAHYWDNIDLSDDRLLRTPVFHNKLSSYYTKTLMQIPDSLIKDGDALIAKMKPNSEIFKYTLVYMLNQMAKSKLEGGFKEVYTHLINNYYAKGYASWLNKEELQKLLKKGKN